MFELERKVTIEEVNVALKKAAETSLLGIWGMKASLVSADYKTDSRSSIVDALSTMVVNDTQLKLYLWYDNEWGYEPFGRVSSLHWDTAWTLSCMTML